MLQEMGRQARTAAQELAGISTEQKNQVLSDLVELLWIERSFILANNELDVEAAQRAGLPSAMIDRLTLNADRLKEIGVDLNSVRELPDPVGEEFEAQRMANNLRIAKARVPLGVLGVIYESRPNVTVDVSGLAIKSGNAAILRGGKETLLSNQALVKLIRMALKKNDISEDCVQLIQDTDRALVLEMLKMNDNIDMIIPRGGAQLHQFCLDNSRIPVMTGGIGICHLYVDESANLPASFEVIRNAKIQRPTVCNALDTVLINRLVAAEFIPRLIDQLALDGVSFRVHESVLGFLPADNAEYVIAAGPDDFDTEWLSLILGIKIVENFTEAVDHIKCHSTGHSDGILTENSVNALRFIKEVDSAAVYVNASTRFTDGAQFGLGAEVAVSTQRLHARGPMGLRELTTYKWIVQGEYHVRP